MVPKAAKRAGRLEFGGRVMELGGCSHIVGILNVTPDSFSDGGRFIDLEAATAQAERMFAEGAAVVDIGGESTRPGFEPVDESVEIDRVAPVVERVLAVRPNALLSVDTSKVAVARAALRAGVAWLNDVWGFQRDPELAEVAAEYEACAVLMRNGRDGRSESGAILERVRRSWNRSVEIAIAAGVPESRIILDPGIGFGTTREEDLDILRGLPVLRREGFPLLIGASRKRVTGQPLGLAVENRLETTLATTAAGVAAGVAFFRVHDVAENARFTSLADLILRESENYE